MLAQKTSGSGFDFCSHLLRGYLIFSLYSVIICTSEDTFLKVIMQNTLYVNKPIQNTTTPIESRVKEYTK